MDPIHSLHFLSIQVYHMKRNPIMRAVVTAKLGKTTEAAASQLDGSMERNTSMSLSPESDQSS